MTDLVCRNGIDFLMDYLEDALPDDVRAMLDEHVAGCAKCVAFIASYRATPQIVREATRVEVPDTAGHALLAYLRRHRYE